MSHSFSRNRMILLWLIVVLGLFAALEVPTSFATGALLLLVWGMVPAIMFLLWQQRSPTMAEVRHQAENRLNERER